MSSHASDVSSEAADYLRREMLTLGRNAYLLCVAVRSLSMQSPSDVAAAVGPSVRALCQRPSRLHGNAKPIEMSSTTVRHQLPTLSAWSLKILFVQLDAVLHGTLDVLARRNRDVDSPSVEADINSHLSNVRSSALAWAYKDAVLLAVFRNCLVHANGVLDPSRHERLIAAGWTETEWSQRISWLNPFFEDFLLLKKAVRSIASACIQSKARALASTAPRQTSLPRTRHARR